MSLTFGGATTDRVTIAANATIDNLSAFTVLLWVRPTTLTSFRRIVAKEVSTTSGWAVRLTGTGGDIRVTWGRATTDVSYVTSSTPLSSLYTWHLVAITFDQSGAAGEVVNIYTGKLTTAAVEASYSTTTGGSGAFDDDSSADLTIGNSAATDLPIQGNIAVAAVINRVLTLQEIISWQWHPRMISGCVGFYQLSDTSSVPDWSGNSNAGAVTGTSLFEHVPLGPWFGRAANLEYVVASGGVNIPVIRHHLRQQGIA
ncbi:MAG: LamG domain-containing protein [Acidobacteria bacterium]|nr:LamG domain-containing protein [Acidobacteriota bacterium]